jgi:hypothetical protein
VVCIILPAIALAIIVFAIRYFRIDIVPKDLQRKSTKSEGWVLPALPKLTRDENGRWVRER